jgi:hypothetical protein
MISSPNIHVNRLFISFHFLSLSNQRRIASETIMMLLSSYPLQQMKSILNKQNQQK